MYRLVMADDEEVSRTTLCECFPWHASGFEMTASFGNGRDLLRWLDTHEADAMLCDIRMPILSGIDVARVLSTRERKPKILFLSGYRDFEYARQAIEFGVRNYLVKPARFDMLSEALARIRQELDQEACGQIVVESAHGGHFDALPEEAAAEMARGSVLAPTGGAMDHLGDKGSADPVIRQTWRYIQENIRSATLEGAARLAHMNASYFSLYVKNRTGTNFSDRLYEARMEQAAMLLRDFSLKTYEISERVGYTSPKNFARSFKARFNLSPRDYRQRLAGFPLGSTIDGDDA